jgi:hypothetical protein
MPLDTRLPLLAGQFKPITYQAPSQANMLAEVAQAASAMQGLQRNAMAMQAERAAREQENALAEYVRGGGAPEGLAQFGAPGARAMQQIQYGQQVAAQTRGVQQKEVEAAMGQFMSALGRTQNAQQARSVLALGFQDPLVSKAIGRFTTPEQAMAGVPDDPAQFNDWLRTQVLAPAERFKERTGAQRYISAGQGRMFDTQTRSYVDMPAAGAPVPAVPAGLTTDQTDRILTQQGYRRRPDGTQEPIPGGRADPETLRRQAEARRPAEATAPQVGARPLSEADINKRRDAVAKEYRNAGTALQNLQETLNSAQQVRTAPGLERATGFSGTYLPSFPGGAAAQAQTRLENLRGKITAMGKATAAMSGAIGSIANQEWKILADQIAVIDPVKGAGPMLEQIASLEQQARSAMERIKDAYEKQFGEDFERFPQFRDLPMPAQGAGLNAPRTTAPARPAAPSRAPAQGGLTPAEQAELEALRRRFGRQQ